jgi:transposase InsO family protein
VKYSFIEKYQVEFPVRLLCSVLDVSKSGYYNWKRKGPDNPKGSNRLRLIRTIEKVHLGSRGSYGSPRVYAHIKGMGFKVSKATVERIMKEFGIIGKKKRKFRPKTTICAPKAIVSPNLLDRKFDQGAPGKVWLADITYLKVNKHWAYLATVLDGHSRKIVGWSVQETLDRSLPIAALEMAINREHPPEGLIHHSDRGSQYASADYRQILLNSSILQSMSRKGNCWDNAPMESFYDSLKCEHVYDCRFQNLSEARRSIFEWIEVFYNRVRLHSALGYKTPSCAHEIIMANAS